MTRLFGLTAAAIVFAGVFGAAGAQSLRSSDGPAEIPPASYAGNQYVDSEGCVFIRAGFGGSTTWVPRVNRQRDVICGFNPTISADTPPRPAPPPAMVVATFPPPPAPPPQIVAPLRTSYVAPPVRVTSPPQTIIVPAPVYAGNDGYFHVPHPPVIAPPPGYKAAWDDGRLNPNRGHVTKEGFVQMRLVWTAGVPRRLVTPETERYRVVNGVPDKYREYTVTGAPVQNRGYIVSTKGEVPASAVTAMPAGHRFVQVGLFSTDAKARAAAAGLQSKGLPVRLGRATHNGTAVVVVLAGPFADAGTLGAGLRKVQGIGYSGAFTRK